MNKAIFNVTTRIKQVVELVASILLGSTQLEIEVVPVKPSQKYLSRPYRDTTY
jgi:hypothetical protein